MVVFDVWRRDAIVNDVGGVNTGESHTWNITLRIMVCEPLTHNALIGRLLIPSLMIREYFIAPSVTADDNNLNS
jgi:hypothetical protein